MRTLGDNGEAFRVRLTWPFNNGRTGKPHATYVGPYASVATAKAQLTRVMTRSSRPSSAVVERAATVWEEVPE